ncbi:MAG: FMN-binding glutamate synthase family protein, partial [Syntrophomonadaceae bacterium]|nr:FMN-binding glutamate synthase family protein [Syntrophomonadaceae bacterium]
PGEKVSPEVALTRMIPAWSDAISPAPHHDIYSIEDLAQLIETLKVATKFKKPIAVKVAAVHNIGAISSGIVRAGADIVVIDGFRGGTGAAPMRIRDNVGIPIEMALAQVDSRLRDEGLRQNASLVIAGGIRNSADVIKSIALGADAVYIGTAALIALGCHMCQMCFTGKCNWGIATTRPELTQRLNPKLGAKKALNLLRAWSHEIMEMMGGMGINAIDSLRGNRLMLQGLGLSKQELDILGVKSVGE